MPLGPFQILAPIGEGGTGEVWKPAKPGLTTPSP